MFKTLASAIVLSASFLGASAVQAAGPSRGELDYPPEAPQTTSLTRAQVVQERDAVREQGPAFAGELDPQALAVGQSDRRVPRAEVVQQRDAARDAGLISRGNLDYPPAQG